MKKILGLDLGTTSIGWAVISEDEGKNEILGMGSRIIPYSENEAGDFKSGTGESKNHNRTLKRTQRKGYDRYQLRRKFLTHILTELKMLPGPELFSLSSLELYGLRVRALREKIQPGELGRIFLHLNQRRGYKHGIKEENTDKKQREFVETIFSRWTKIKGSCTVGEYLFNELKNNPFFRIKDKIFPREAYVSEFNEIWSHQAGYYPEILTDELQIKIRDEIIYFQRKLRSQKGLVSICEFSGFWTVNKKSKTPGSLIFTGPKVAPRSSPLSQEAKIWESINTIEITRVNPETRKYEKHKLDPAGRLAVYRYLSDHENLSESKLFELIGIPKGQGFATNEAIRKRGIQGNTTRVMVLKALNGEAFPPELFSFHLHTEEFPVVNKDTGEVQTRKKITGNVENMPYYRFWHTLYSNEDPEKLKRLLVEKYHISESGAEKLSVLDFTKGGYSNKSVKTIRYILPYLQEGFLYSDACMMAGFSHSDSKTREERSQKVLADQLKLLPRNSLRQPIVEKILNQMINLVNAVLRAYGRPDEVRVELARELKQSKEERNKYFLDANARNRQNKIIADRLEQEYHVKANRRTIEKWRLYHEVGGRCLYCNRQISLTQLLTGVEADIEHIIPRAVYFDDSFSNKTISHIKCNKDKKDRTAFDFMSGKTETELQDYLDRVTELFHSTNRIDEGAQCFVNKISKVKYRRLLMERNDIPQDFITRQLRETQYIARKAREILEDIAVDVSATSGAVTERLRHLWGWDDVLMQLQINKYREAGLTEWIDVEENGSKRKKEIIPGWSKRNDHRHHAIDALAIACTKQGFIQRINTLSSEQTRQSMYREVGEVESREKLTLLEKYLISCRPFTTEEVKVQTANVLVSFKPGKKVATRGVRKIREGRNTRIVQSGIIVPRGALSEESVYGMIKVRETAPLKSLFMMPAMIVDDKIKTLILARLDEHEQDVKRAIASCKKHPLSIPGQDQPIERVAMFREEIVIKYPVTSLKVKDIDSIVDPVVREIVRKRLGMYGNREKDAFKDLESNPVWYNEARKIPIKTVRCRTGLTSVAPLKIWDDKTAKGYVKPGNNHHIALYRDEQGNMREHVVTFWHAVERKKYNLPVIIKEPERVWSDLMDRTDLPESFLSNLPGDRWSFVLSMEQNQMFLLGMTDEQVRASIESGSHALVSENLYRVQKLGASYYTFRHHLETQIDDSATALKSKRFYRIQSFGALASLNPTKVTINCLGKIVTSM